MNNKKDKVVLGIWMDHAHAQIIECPNRGMEIRVVKNDFTHQAKQESLQKGELHMHHKEQQQQAKYYANLAEVIRHYKDVVLFGPTDAKIELYNIIKSDAACSDIDIDVVQSDNITENQKVAFVREHFFGH